jgi:RNA polymerase sigma-70 factor (ECF subfamily)
MDNPRWAGLVEQYFDRVFRWCIDGGVDEHTAADIAQEVFISALGSLHRFKRSDQSTFSGWLRRITQRRIADHWRRKRERAVGGTEAIELFSQLTSIRNSVDPDHIDQGLDDERLLNAIASVQSDYQGTSWRAFWMTTVEGRSATDAAFELGITRNAVYLAKSRITKRLQTVIEEEDKPIPPDEFDS